MSLEFYIKINALVSYSCFDTLFIINNSLECDHTCATCNAPGPSGCTSCDLPSTLNNGQCISTTLFSQFLISYNLINLLVCHLSCATCSGTSANECLTCTSPNQLYQGSCISKQFSMPRINLCVSLLISMRFFLCNMQWSFCKSMPDLQFSKPAISRVLHQ